MCGNGVPTVPVLGARPGDLVGTPVTPLSGPRRLLELGGMKPLSQYRAVLFDLDGTLVDDSNNSALGCVRWAAEVGVVSDPERWVAIESKWFRAFERGEVSYLGQRYMRVREYLGDPSLSDERCAELFERFVEHYLAACVAYPDAHPALLQALDTGVPVGIVTNGGGQLQTRKMQTAWLWSDSLLMFGAQELGVAKPQPAIYRAVQQHLGVEDPADLVLIGDNLVNDFLAPKEAGWAAVLVDRHGRHGEYPAIGSLAELVWF